MPKMCPGWWGQWQEEEEMTQHPEGAEGGGMSSVPMAGRLEINQKEMGGEAPHWAHSGSTEKNFERFLNFCSMKSPRNYLHLNKLRYVDLQVWYNSCILHLVYMYCIQSFYDYT